jgi:hypothetical protein
MAKEWVDSFLIARDYTCDLVSVEGVCVSVVMIVTPLVGPVRTLAAVHASNIATNVSADHRRVV